MQINEKPAAVNMASIDGREDSALCYGKDPTFLRWAEDLFNYYWEQGKHIPLT